MPKKMGAKSQGGVGDALEGGGDGDTKCGVSDVDSMRERAASGEDGGGGDSSNGGGW